MATIDIETSEKLRRLEHLYKEVSAERHTGDEDLIMWRMRLQNISWAMDAERARPVERPDDEVDEFSRMKEEGWK